MDLKTSRGVPLTYPSSSGQKHRGSPNKGELVTLDEREISAALQALYTAALSRKAINELSPALNMGS